MIINKYSDSLEKVEDIYYSKNKSKVSYPDSGNDFCFGIEDKSFWFKHRNRCISTLIKLMSPSKTFFDVGGGNGFVAKELEENGIETVLVEPGIQGARNARSRGVKNVICSSLKEANFNKGSIPTMGLFDVVEHIEYDKEFLMEAYSLLENEGLIYITVPAYNFLWSSHDEYAGHYRRYTLSGLQELLESANFKVIYSTYFFSILPLAIFIFRTIPSFFRIEREKTKFKRREKQHSNRKGVFRKLIDRLWEFEIKRISKIRKVPIGGSCLIVGRKEVDS